MNTILRDISITQHTLHFKKPLTIAYEEASDASIIVVRIEDENGCVGLGSAAPDEYVTGEQIDRTYATLKKRLSPDFFFDPIDNESVYRKKIRQLLRGYPSAQSATEEALTSLRAAQLGIEPLSTLGRCREACTIAVTIGIMPLEETVREAQERIVEGFSTIKLKCGLDPDADIEKIIAFRDALPKNTQLILDANQGYSPASARRVIMAIRDYNIAGFEQPVCAQDIETLKELCSLECMPIIADEAVQTPRHALKLLRDGYADGINIKLMKCGGVSNAISMIQAAQKLHKLIMLGCMYESNISITTAARLALAFPVDFVDLDSGHMDFDDDPACGGASVHNGVMSIKEPVRLCA